MRVSKPSYNSTKKVETARTEYQYSCIAALTNTEY